LIPNSFLSWLCACHNCLKKNQFLINKYETGKTMIDDVLLWVDTPAAFNVQKHLDAPKETANMNTGEIVVTGYYKNLRTRLKASGLSIQGSLNKYLYGNNLESMSRRSVQDSISKLSDELSLSINNGIVYRFDIACNFVMKRPLGDYLSKLGSVRYFKKSEISNLQTVIYSNCNRALIFYDKIAEVKKKGGAIPELFKGKNVLRYEMRFRKRIKDQFKKVVTAADLYDEKFYSAAIKQWKSSYFAISRFNDVAGGLSMVGGVKELESSLILLGMQAIGGGEVVFQQIESAYRMGKIDKQQAHRMKNKIKQVMSNPSLTAPPETIKELDKKISQVAMFCR
jgi:hypothetical protein